VQQLRAHSRILLGVTPLTKPLFDSSFPELQQVALPAYNIRYSGTLPLWTRLGLDSPRILRVIREEHQCIEQIVKEHGIEVVISDNRFGLHTSKAHTVFVTHQLYVKAPLLSAGVNRLNQRFIKRFDEVWVPDYEPLHASLSGALAHGKERIHPHIRYIGPLSRLADVEATLGAKSYDVLLLLSGPEPQRSLLEEGLLRNLPPCRAALVRGTTAPLATAFDGDVFDFPDAATLKGLILSGTKVVCRSGYSSLMDMHLCGKKESDLVLIPTPGQSEQEYLAAYWQQHFGAQTCKQSQLVDLRNKLSLTHGKNNQSNGNQSH